MPPALARARPLASIPLRVAVDALLTTSRPVDSRVAGRAGRARQPIDALHAAAVVAAATAAVAATGPTGALDVAPRPAAIAFAEARVARAPELASAGHAAREGVVGHAHAACAEAITARATHRAIPHTEGTALSAGHLLGQLSAAVN